MHERKTRLLDEPMDVLASAVTSNVLAGPSRCDNRAT